MGRTRYRLYVDESGDDEYEYCDRLPRRYLGITGIAMPVRYHDGCLTDELSELKIKHFDTDAVVLTRSNILDKVKPPFDRLNEPELEVAFGCDLLKLLRRVRFHILTVTMDKWWHLRIHSTPRAPYHYSWEVLIEKLMMYYNDMNAEGDVLAEARDGKANKALDAAHQEFYRGGTRYHSAEDLQSVLTSNKIKFGTKGDNVAGLQVADMLAAPWKEYMIVRERREWIAGRPKLFTRKILGHTSSKEYWSHFLPTKNSLELYGTKWKGAAGLPLPFTQTQCCYPSSVCAWN